MLKKLRASGYIGGFGTNMIIILIGWLDAVGYRLQYTVLVYSPNPEEQQGGRSTKNHVYPCRQSGKISTLLRKLGRELSRLQ